MKTLGLWDNSLHMQNLRWAMRRWWFWVGVVILIPVVWYVWGYASWWLAGADSRAENMRAYQGWLAMEAESAALEAQYRADNYGGATPEETLRLFIEALEKKDYELAAKYFVVENQSAELNENRMGEEGGANAYFINAYRKGRIVPPDSVGSSGIYELAIYPQGDDTAFGVRFIKNPYSGKWKILEL